MPANFGRIVSMGVVVIVALIVVSGAFGTVGAGQRGVLLRFEAPTGKILDEGLYFKVPFIEDVALMSTQIHKYTAPATSSSKDLQVVTTEVTLNYQLMPAEVAEVYRTLRRNYESLVIQPFIQEAVKSTTANYNAEELITQRPAVKTALQELLADRLKPRGLDVVQVSITDFQFSNAFQQAIEAKVTAVQQALEAENALRRVEFEAKQQIEQARAEAKGLELQRAQVTTELIQLRQIEVQRSAVEKWNGVMPTVVTSGGPVPMLDVFTSGR
ncbi:MAG: prohibitin family protein [Acidobacteriota bacterium]|nr:prohibitin family protein [Acidobacteriota bacterium]